MTGTGFKAGTLYDVHQQCKLIQGPDAEACTAVVADGVVSGPLLDFHSYIQYLLEHGRFINIRTFKVSLIKCHSIALVDFSC